MSDSKQNDHGDTRSVAYYVVALIDLLGQSNRLAAWKSLPTNDAEREEFLVALKNSAGHVDAFRDAFTKYFGAFAGSRDTSMSRGLSQEQLEAFHRITHSEVRHQHFSDTVILYSQVAMPELGPTANGIYLMLGAAAMSELMFLAKGIPLRGAIEVGLGTDAFDNEIYGPVLDHAYRLEQEVAQYPRIVVGQNLLGLLQALSNPTEDTAFARVQKKMAMLSKEMILLDVDGVPFVNFLGKHFRENLSQGAPEVTAAVSAGFNFVRRTHEKYRHSGNWKLAGRYASLHGYYEHLVREWLIDPKESSSQSSRSSP